MSTAQYNRYALLSEEDSPQRGSPETVPASDLPRVASSVRPSDRRPISEKKPWRRFQGTPEKKPQPARKAVAVPAAVIKQLELRKKHNYTYRVVSNGNIENNCTLYVNTGVAHAHQIEELFKDAIERAKKMPEVFGDDFECDVKVNVVRRHSGEYMAYAFVDLTNPKLYYALIGCNVDGSERAIYVDDPNWSPPASTPPTAKISWATGKSWADDDDDEPIFRAPPSAPKIRRELPPLLTLRSYTYDKQQMEHLQTQETQGTVTVSPAFITPGVNDEYDDCSLYVSEVPEVDYDFLYEIFSRYARSSSPDEDETHFFPKITIRKSNKEGAGKGLYAIVQYAHPYDAKYALQMLQKIRARYNGVDISMPVRHAFRNRRKKR